jgi:hypothetical protein
MGVEDEVLAGTSGSLLDQPKEFIESRNEDEAIVTRHSTLFSLVIPIFPLSIHNGNETREERCPLPVLDFFKKNNTRSAKGPGTGVCAAWNARRGSGDFTRRPVAATRAARF